MSLPSTTQTFGGPYADAIPIDDPTTTESSAYHNILTQTVAEGTNTATRAWVQFTTRGTNGAATVTGGQSMMGVSSAALPTVARTGAGLYTITYPVSWSKSLGPPTAPLVVAESIVFTDASGSVVSTSTMGRVQPVPAGNLINVLVISNVAGTDTASDLGGGVTIRVEAR